MAADMLTQPLNFASKVIDQFAHGGNPSLPISAAALRYVRDKLIAAEKFVLPSGGRLLPTDREKPHVPGLVFRPPFPVVALEYAMGAESFVANDGLYTACHAPKRIALAWDWQDDFPPIMRSRGIEKLAPGVAIMEISYRTDLAGWMPGIGCMHLAYDDHWKPMPDVPPFLKAMVRRGQVAPKFAQPGRITFPFTFVPMFAEALVGKARDAGSMAAAIDYVQSDTNDEMIAYLDLCYALACKNVSTERHAAPERLNRSRIKAGKMPLFDFHTLMLESDTGNGEGFTGTGRSAARAHLRRGHIRRLGPNRITWVNSTMVRGRGFVDKVYGVREKADG